MQPDLSIIIVNYNVKHFLEQCLMAIEKARHGLQVEIFVVDNASVDGSQGLLKKKFPYVKLIENHKNLGFSKANNQALRQANAAYILMLNPDTLIQEDTLITLKKFLDEHPQTGAVGCKLINPDGTFQIACRRSIPTPWIAFTRIVGLSKIFPKSPVFGKYNLTYLDPDLQHEVDVLSGSLMMVRKDIISRIGYFDEDYFMYGEDIDLCYRIKKAGMKVFYVPTTKAIHYKGESTKKGEFPFISNFYTAMLLFINKHFKNHYSIVLKLLLIAGIYIRAAVAYLYLMFKSLLPSLIDAVLVVACIYLSIKIWLPHYSLERFGVIYPIYTVIWLVSMYLAGAYHARGKYHIKPVLNGTLFGLLLNATFTYFFNQFAYSRVVVIISFLLITAVLSTWRLLYRVLIPQAMKHSLSKLRRVIIVGVGKEGERILKKLRTRPDLPFEICGFVDFDENNIGKEIDGTEVLATTENIKDLIRVEKIDDIIFSSDRLTNVQILETIANAQGSGVVFRIVPHKLEFIIAKSVVDEFDSMPLLDFLNVYDPVDSMVKRFIDIFVSFLVSTVTAPLVLINWLIGARLISDRIITEKGQIKEIMQYKRGIPFLKNVPLFWHIFKGTISLVGAEYINPHTTTRRPVYKSGITGLNQLRAKQKKKQLTQQEKDYYDLYYLRNRSVITDLQILIKSIF
ncbi:MAG TPA: glycosyltransferase [bacterium]